MWMPSRPEQPLKADKGKRGGSCNRRACQAPPANYFNRGSGKWYCEDCAVELNAANRDFRHYGKDEPMCVPAEHIDADPDATRPF
jgi:hypothetical protein